jgi:FKBP-type peptidyl-prolyl cis-trans isomerase
MTQTAKDPKNSTAKRHRPGQRQQERLQRLERRKRRQRTITASIVALILIGLIGLAYWQYQQYNARQQATANAHATATANIHATSTAHADATGTALARVTATANAQASATAIARGEQTAFAGSSIPSAGPATPPPATGKTVTLADGLKYIDIKVGSGPAAKKGSTVMVEYTGWLESNGKKFDSSYDHGGTPFKVAPLGTAQVIQGWNEGLIGIQAGGTRRLIIPAALAYGAQGAPPTIPPNATLIFDVTAVLVQ